MRWRKLGRVFEPVDRGGWMRSHAANPVAVVGGGDEVEVWFNCRDAANRSSIARFRFRPDAPDAPVRLDDAPLLSPGSYGAFDESGVSLACVVEVGPARHLYYLGWNLTPTVPWRNAIGLAVSPEPGAPFTRVSPGPILDRDTVDPYTLSYPWVLREDGRWRMWYGSHLTWGEAPDQWRHALKYAESGDGIHWRRDGRVVVGHERPGEYAISKPCVLRDPDRYRMWYAYRGASYRIGYAESPDGLAWTRRDAEVGIDVSPDGWDHEMIDYPCVFDWREQRYLLYNGNGYGATGIGLAVLEERG